MNLFRKISLGVCLVLVSAAMHCFNCGKLLADQSATAQVVLTVTDEGGEPIEQPTAIMFRWTGEIDLAKQAPVEQHNDQFHFSGMNPDHSWLLAVQAPGRATTLNFVHDLSAGETRELTIKMSPAAASWLQIKNENGEPIAGAKLSLLEFTDANHESGFIRPEMSTSLGFEFAVSDATGRLDLPPLPIDHQCSVTIYHPDWQSRKLNDAAIVDGKIGDATLKRGVTVECALKQLAGDHMDLNQQIVNVELTALEHSQINPTHLFAKFPVVDDRVRFTVAPAQFQLLNLEMESYVVLPSILHDPVSPDVRLDFSTNATKVHTFEFTVKPKRKIRGRIVDVQGKPISDASVGTSVAVNDESTWLSEVDKVDRLKIAREWVTGGWVDSDHNGNFEVDAAGGKVMLESIAEGYFQDPVSIELVLADDGDLTLPDIVLYPVPKLTGKVIDASGKPVAGAYVRMRHPGYGVADPTCQSADDGSFELTMSRIPYSPDASLQTDVSVVALNAKDRTAGRAALSLKDAVACENIVVQLKPQPTDWLMAVVEPNDFYAAISAEAFTLARANAIKEHPAGQPGKSVPDLSSGTWLNSDAKSLADFRGKLVLLDFWFVGCGPCERDLPSIKLAHATYSEMGFAVIGVHRGGESRENIQRYLRKNKITHPIVVDDADDSIVNQFREIGLEGFPYYVLLDADGTILHNDAIPSVANLRNYKLELIYQALEQAADAKAAEERAR